MENISIRRVRHFTIGLFTVVLIALLYVAIKPSNQITAEQFQDSRQVGELLNKMDRMCAEAGVNDLQDSYLGQNYAVICSSFGGAQKVAGYLPGEGVRLNTRFIQEHGFASE